MTIIYNQPFQDQNTLPQSNGPELVFSRPLHTPWLLIFQSQSLQDYVGIIQNQSFQDHHNLSKWQSSRSGPAQGPRPSSKNAQQNVNEGVTWKTSSPTHGPRVVSKVKPHYVHTTKHMALSPQQVQSLCPQQRVSNRWNRVGAKNLWAQPGCHRIFDLYTDTYNIKTLSSDDKIIGSGGVTFMDQLDHHWLQ